MCLYLWLFIFKRFSSHWCFPRKIAPRVRLDMWKGSYDVDNKEVKRWDEGIERAIKKKKKEIGRKSKGLDIFSVLNFCQFFFKYASRCFSQHSTKLAIKILMSEMSDQAWTNFYGKISYHILYISSIYLLMYFWFFRSSKHYQKWLFPAK